MLFIITLVLLILGIKNKRLSSCGPRPSIKIAFPFTLLIAVFLPFFFEYLILTTVVVPIVLLVGWMFVIAPLWRGTSKTGKVVAGILSYPGTFLYGGWPLTFAPGILALPFGLWLPAPFMTFVLKAIGNTKGFGSSLILDSFSLVFWASLFGCLMAYSISKNKANNRMQSDAAEPRR